MSHLQNKGKETVDTYKYAIKKHPSAMCISIIFVDGKFSRCAYPFSGTYDREQWDILGEVAEKIAAIEQFYIGGKSVKNKDI